MPKSSSVVSSRRGQRWLYIFLAAAVVLLIGLASLVWPRVVVHITPSFEVAQVTVPVKIDLDISEPVISSLVLPGREVSSATATSAEYVVSLPRGQYVAVRRDLVRQIADLALAQVVGEEREERQGSRALRFGAAVVARSGRLITVSLAVQSEVYHVFPLVEWRAKLLGLSFSDARDYLQAQRGVKNVFFQVKPIFLANLSQKMPKAENAISLSLDIP